MIIVNHFEEIDIPFKHLLASNHLIISVVTFQPCIQPVEALK